MMIAIATLAVALTIVNDIANQRARVTFAVLGLSMTLGPIGLSLQAKDGAVRHPAWVGSFATVCSTGMTIVVVGLLLAMIALFAAFCWDETHG
jgi:hypothetical protein